MFQKISTYVLKKYGIFNPKHILIHLSKQKRDKHVKENPSIHLKQNSNLNTAQAYQQTKHIKDKTLTY